MLGRVVEEIKANNLSAEILFTKFKSILLKLLHHGINMTKYGTLP